MYSHEEYYDEKSAVQANLTRNIETLTIRNEDKELDGKMETPDVIAAVEAGSNKVCEVRSDVEDRELKKETSEATVAAEPGRSGMCEVSNGMCEARSNVEDRELGGKEETPEVIVAVEPGSRDVCEVRNNAEDVTLYHGPSYPCAYIRVVEGWTGRSASKTVNDLMQKYLMENPECLVTAELQANSGREREKRKHNKGKKVEVNTAEDGYEKATARHGDKAFLKFQKELAKCPQQILRYLLWTLLQIICNSFAILNSRTPIRSS